LVAIFVLVALEVGVDIARKSLGSRNVGQVGGGAKRKNGFFPPFFRRAAGAGPAAAGAAPAAPIHLAGPSR
jgi:hypothetical protein